MDKNLLGVMSLTIHGIKHYITSLQLIKNQQDFSYPLIDVHIGVDCAITPHFGCPDYTSLFIYCNQTLIVTSCDYLVLPTKYDYIRKLMLPTNMVII